MLRYTACDRTTAQYVSLWCYWQTRQARRAGLSSSEQSLAPDDERDHHQSATRELAVPWVMVSYEGPGPITVMAD